MTIESETNRRIFHLFADILDYPRHSVVESTRECERLLSIGNPEAAALLQDIKTFVESNELGQIQEVYTVTFDLNATYHPYIGHHLFGESYKRSAFMLGLKEWFKTHDFVVESELPDHLAVVLRFLSLGEASNEIDEIIQEAMLPALERMVKEDDDQDDEIHEQDHSKKVYLAVLKSLQLFLQGLKMSDPFLVRSSSA